jgi:hypothetical protein
MLVSMHFEMKPISVEGRVTCFEERLTLSYGR